MTDDELSVRLEWPERHNEPFRPSVDDDDRPGTPRARPAGDDVAELHRAVAELRSEVAALRAEVARLTGSPGPAPRDGGRRSRQDRRPIRVRNLPADEP